MPSTYYNVAITALSTSGEEGAGFIDPTRVEQYMKTGAAPTTAEQSRNKERANIRYKQMVGSLGMMANLYVSNVAATGANASTAPTTLSFTLQSEKGDEVLRTADENNAGVVLEEDDAIKRVIARTLLINRTTVSDYYDPTVKEAIIPDGTTSNAVRTFNRVQSLVVNAVADDLTEAEGAITVTKI